MIVFLLFILLLVIALTQPWVDVYKDYREIKHIVLWYTDFITGERKFINITGSQK